MRACSCIYSHKMTFNFFFFCSTPKGRITSTSPLSSFRIIGTFISFFQVLVLLHEKVLIVCSVHKNQVPFSSLFIRKKTTVLPIPCCNCKVFAQPNHHIIFPHFIPFKPQFSKWYGFALTNILWTEKLSIGKVVCSRSTYVTLTHRNVHFQNSWSICPVYVLYLVSSEFLNGSLNSNSRALWKWLATPSTIWNRCSSIYYCLHFFSRKKSTRIPVLSELLAKRGAKRH